ncbi:MAG TPA: EAL domain-containing protein, partial [Bacillota bacterium]|nr:EAL domain-containing protein [Bacillota bacterium]
LIREPMKGIDQALTASIGVVVFPYDGINADQLYKNAEIAVYVAKKAGKNRLHMYSEDLIETEQSNIDYYQEIKKSIQNDEFLLYYQTIVDIKTGKIIGLESLLRWKHPTKGILPPGKFLNVMELTGDITWFGTWGFEKNVMQYKNWRAKTRVGDLFISTNLSPKQLEVDGLAHQFYNITKKYGLSPELFCLEIINFYGIVKSHVAMTNIAQFRKYGFRIAIDDLGTKFEIIEDMKHLNAGIIKLSRENVLLIMDNAEEVPSLKHVVREAMEKSKIVIAEGVENEEMIKVMYDLGIRFMQGYFFNQPKSVLEIEKMIMQSPWDMNSFDHITEGK